MILYYFLIALTPAETPPVISRVFHGDYAFKVVGGVCLCYGVFYLLKKGSAPRFFKTWQARCFALLFILAGISQLTKGLNPFLKSDFFIYVDFALFLFLTVALVDSVKRLEWTLLAAVAGVGYVSVDVIREWVHYHALIPGYRAGMSAGNPNYFATSAVVCLPFAFFMALNADKRWKRMLCMGCLPISLLAIALTGSRGGLLALVVAFGLVIWFSPHRVRNLILACVVIIPFLIFAPVSPIQRLINPSKSDVHTEETRLITWQAGIEMFKAHPLTGVGLGNFKKLAIFYETGPKAIYIAHNTYIGLVAELGFAGPILFLIIVVAAIVSLDRARRQSRLQGPAALYYGATSLEAGLAGYLVGAIFLSGQYAKLLWVAVFLSICISRLAQSGGVARQAGAHADQARTQERAQRHPDAIVSADRI